MVAGGMVLGALAAVMVGRLLETLLFDVRPSDPIALGLAALVFGVVALAACFFPALRASRVDLMDSLRQD
jgi:putative ABC transport system permease protein